VEALLKAVQREFPSPDFVLWAGDDAPADVWETSEAEILASVGNLSALVRAALPGVPVLPTVGNHEGFPVNQFRGPGYDAWIYEALAADWGPWLSEEARAQLAYGGYYAQNVSARLRVLSYNTMFGSTLNFWLALNESDGDLGGQLAWLDSQLSAAAAAGQKVYVIGHVPPGFGTVPAYSARLNAIFAAHRDVLAGLFYGHTHKDQVSVVTDPANASDPLAVCYLAPSLTPFTNINPSFRAYYYNRTSGAVLDYEQFTMNLTFANEEDRPEFDLVYAARAAYGLEDLSPASWLQFGQALATNSSLMDAYVSYHYTLRPVQCGASCEKRLRCVTVTSSPTAARACIYAPDSRVGALV
jgi:sphingomyelin phosphodiesterase